MRTTTSFDGEVEVAFNPYWSGSSEPLCSNLLGNLAELGQKQAYDSPPPTQCFHRSETSLFGAWVVSSPSPIAHHPILICTTIRVTAALEQTCVIALIFGLLTMAHFSLTPSPCSYSSVYHSGLDCKYTACV